MQKMFTAFMGQVCIEGDREMIYQRDVLTTGYRLQLFLKLWVLTIPFTNFGLAIVYKPRKAKR